MMAGLFAIFSLALLFAVSGHRQASIATTFVGILLSFIMFWHHATDVLKINW